MQLEQHEQRSVCFCHADVLGRLQLISIRTLAKPYRLPPSFHYRLITSYVVLVRDCFESGSLLDVNPTALEVCLILGAEAFVLV
jgi:hypothetical protein